MSDEESEGFRVWLGQVGDAAIKVVENHQSDPVELLMGPIVAGEYSSVGIDESHLLLECALRMLVVLGGRPHHSIVVWVIRSSEHLKREIDHAVDTVGNALSFEGMTRCEGPPPNQIESDHRSQWRFEYRSLWLPRSVEIGVWAGCIKEEEAASGWWYMAMELDTKKVYERSTEIFNRMIDAVAVSLASETRFGESTMRRGGV